jgi:hypothetical protein
VSNFWFNVRLGRRFVQWTRGAWMPTVSARMDDTWMAMFGHRPVRVFVLFGRQLP